MQEVTIAQSEYQELLDKAEELETLKHLQRSLEDAKAGRIVRIK